MITRQSLIGDILRECENAPEVLMSMGMHCLGCPSAQMEALEDACLMHDVNVDDILAQLNKEA